MRAVRPYHNHEIIADVSCLTFPAAASALGWKRGRVRHPGRRAESARLSGARGHRRRPAGSSLRLFQPRRVPTVTYNQYVSRRNGNPRTQAFRSLAGILDVAPHPRTPSPFMRMEQQLCLSALVAIVADRASRTIPAALDRPRTADGSCRRRESRSRMAWLRAADKALTALQGRKGAVQGTDRIMLKVSGTVMSQILVVDSASGAGRRWTQPPFSLPGVA